RKSMRVTAAFLGIQPCDAPQLQCMGRSEAPHDWRKERCAAAALVPEESWGDATRLSKW
ncbi:hypothetical protein HAX54_008104, partial [Datura stramonium]|nr:hypothetical protein [Datura stramonium]